MFKGYNSVTLQSAESAFRSYPEAYHPEVIAWIYADFQAVPASTKRSDAQDDRNEEYGMLRAEQQASRATIRQKYIDFMKTYGIKKSSSGKSLPN